MPKQNQRVQTGNRIVVLFDGKQIGLMQSVNSSDSYGLEAASGIGDIHVVEHVPTVANHMLSVTNMVLNNQSMIEAGLVPENGDAALKGLVFDIEQYSKDTGKLLRKYIGCSYDSGSIDVAKHAIVVRQGQFKALDTSGTGL